MKYAKFSDAFLSDFRLDDNGETLVLTDKRGFTRAVRLLPYEERPKGEWKLVERDNQDIDVVCPFCNSIRFPAYSHGYMIEELEEYLIRQHLPNFCEDCGADMRKGGAE